MKIIFSPTKSQKINNLVFFKKTKILFSEKRDCLMNILSEKNIVELRKNLKISEKIASDVFSFYKKDMQEKKYPTISLFSGTSFKNLSLEKYSDQTLSFAQKNLVIFSGLYGILRPLDAISQYRLDFEDKIFYKNLPHKKVSDFWKKDIEEYFSGIDKILNLASKEYSEILEKKYPEKMVYVHFLQNINGVLKSQSMELKKQRGKILNYILLHEVSDLKVLVDYSSDGFFYNSDKSDENNLFFIK